MGVTAIWRGIVMCVELLRGAQTNSKCLLVASVSITAAKVA